jgi:hypothetical protein
MLEMIKWKIIEEINNRIIKVMLIKENDCTKSYNRSCFTGLFCSFFSINIFANPVFISVTILGSLLPDIDHTKSWIGKSVYPIAKWLSRNYGHTITHSIF